MGHRAFLDANVLFSAAYRAKSGLLALWSLPDTALVTSDYAVLDALCASVEIVSLDTVARTLFTTIALPDKDWPILLAAIESRATHLLTGDAKHFGGLFGSTIEGVMIVRPGEYLRSRDE